MDLTAADLMAPSEDDRGPPRHGFGFPIPARARSRPGSASRGPMPPPVIPSQARAQRAPGRTRHAGAGPAAAHRAEITAAARGLAHQQLTPALLGAG